MSISIHGRSLDDARRTDASSICTLIADHLGIDHEHVKEQSHFMRDFGLDWLDQLELVIFIEEVSGVELPDDDIDQIRFVADLVRSIKRAEQSGSAVIPDATQGEAHILGSQALA